MRIVDRIGEKLASKLEKRVVNRRDGNPYLERYYIFHGSKFKFLPGIYLHKFLSGDEDPELHNHPWGSSVSLILSGGYLEERRKDKIVDGEVKRHVVSKKITPGMFNLIKKNDFHRVDLLEDYAWTIFFSGNREQDWGFWNRDTDEYVPWRDHVSK